MTCAVYVHKGINMPKELKNTGLHYSGPYSILNDTF